MERSQSPRLPAANPGSLPERAHYSMARGLALAAPFLPRPVGESAAAALT